MNTTKNDYTEYWVMALIGVVFSLGGWLSEHATWRVIEKDFGVTYSQLKAGKDRCEADIPRNAECIATTLFIKTEKKND